MAHGIVHGPMQRVHLPSRSGCLAPSSTQSSRRKCQQRFLSTRGKQRVLRRGIVAAGDGQETDAKSPLQYELQVIKDAQASTVDRWKDMYEQQAKDAMAVGLPQSAVPPLPEHPMQADIKQAADKLRRIMQSFESAAL